MVIARKSCAQIKLLNFIVGLGFRGGQNLVIRFYVQARALSPKTALFLSHAMESFLIKQLARCSSITKSRKNVDILRNKMSRQVKNMWKEDLRTQIDSSVLFFIREVNILLGISGFYQEIFSTSSFNAVRKTVHITQKYEVTLLSWPKIWTLSLIY